MNIAPDIFGGNLRLALSAIERYMVLVPLVFKQVLITNVVIRRMMDIFSPRIMRNKNWPCHWTSPLGDRVCGRCGTVTSCNAILFLFCQALELGHRGLFTVETIFTQLIGWKQRLAPCPVVIALQARGTDCIAGSLGPGPECCGGSAPVERAGFKRIL